MITIALSVAALVVAVIVLALVVGYVADRRERARHIATPSPIEQERFRGFHIVGGTDQEFADLLAIGRDQIDNRRVVRGL